jgi:hypothetical protein
MWKYSATMESILNIKVYIYNIDKKYSESIHGIYYEYLLTFKERHSGYSITMYNYVDDLRVNLEKSKQHIQFNKVCRRKKLYKIAQNRLNEKSNS